MLKFIELRARRAGEVDRAAFVERWNRALVAWRGADDGGARPNRITAGEVLHDVDGTDRRFDVVLLAWFDDPAHLERALPAWDRLVAEHLGAADDPTATRRVVAHEETKRGAEWMATRWERGGPQFKHMAIAHRAAGLTPEQFSELWRSRAGTVKQGSGAVTAIPDDVRGLAYVQNHVASEVGHGSDFDAVNEIYFDELAGLERRVRWFAEQSPGGEDDLVGDHWFLAVRETVVD